MDRATFIGRWLWLLLAAIGLAALLTYAVVQRQRHQRNTALLTLGEALWVTERDHSRYYPPGSPEARSAAGALVAQDRTLSARQFEVPVLYRRGLTDTDAGSEAVLVMNFDPATIAADRVRPFRE